MKPLISSIAVGFLAFLTALPICYAGADTPRIDLRQLKQQRRIDQGVESGRLTAKEAQQLENQQNRIQGMENKAKADGIVTRNERARLTHRQNKASHSIYRKKHNLRRQ